MEQQRRLSKEIWWMMPINSWAEVTSWGSREAWYCVIRVLPQWQISLRHFRCLHMGKIDVITFKYVIIPFFPQKTDTSYINLFMVFYNSIKSAISVAFQIIDNKLKLDRRLQITRLPFCIFRIPKWLSSFSSSWATIADLSLKFPINSNFACISILFP